MSPRYRGQTSSITGCLGLLAACLIIVVLVSVGVSSFKRAKELSERSRFTRTIASKPITVAPDPGVALAARHHCDSLLPCRLRLPRDASLPSLQPNPDAERMVQFESGGATFRLLRVLCAGRSWQEMAALYREVMKRQTPDLAILDEGVTTLHGRQTYVLTARRRQPEDRVMRVYQITSEEGYQVQFTVTADYADWPRVAPLADTIACTVELGVFAEDPPEAEVRWNPPRPVEIFLNGRWSEGLAKTQRGNVIEVSDASGRLSGWVEANCVRPRTTPSYQAPTPQAPTFQTPTAQAPAPAPPAVSLARGATELLKTFSNVGPRDNDGAVTLSHGARIVTPNKFRPPATFRLVLLSDGGDLRLAYAANQIIFNWEMRKDELRIDGGPASGKHQKGAGALPDNQWVTLELKVLPNEMQISVDSTLRCRIPANFSNVNEPLTITAHRGKVRLASVQQLSQ